MLFRARRKKILQWASGEPRARITTAYEEREIVKYNQREKG